MQTPPSDTLATPENPLVLISSRVSAAIDGFFLQLPNILATAVFVVLVYFAAKYLGRLVTRVVARRDRPDLGTLMGSLTTGTIWIIGLLGAAAILFPNKGYSIPPILALSSSEC